jgi:8-oxo-dGTP pyrophosphatase MutT (NUDIX family)
MHKFNIKPYKILESKIEYENPYFEVRKDRVIVPDGREKDYFIVEKGRIFSIAIPLTADNKTYLVGQYRPAPRVYSLEFPMGYANGKDALGMAKTELKEETGLTAKNWEEIGKFHLAPGHTGQIGYIFVASGLIKGEPEFEENEFIDIKSNVKILDIERMIISGKITDGPTIVAYYFLREYLKRSK